MIISAPAKEPDVTVALGVNFETYDPALDPSSPTLRARPTASHRSRRSCTKGLGFATA